MKRCLRRGMKVTRSVNLSTVGEVTVLSPNVTCLSVFFLETTKFTKKTCEAKVSRHSELGYSGSSMTFKRYLI